MSVVKKASVKLKNLGHLEWFVRFLRICWTIYSHGGLEKGYMTKEQLEEIRRQLRGLEVETDVKELRKIYDNDKQLQFPFESFEHFVRHIQSIKDMIDRMKYQFRSTCVE